MFGELRVDSHGTLGFRVSGSVFISSLGFRDYFLKFRQSLSLGARSLPSTAAVLIKSSSQVVPLASRFSLLLPDVQEWLVPMKLEWRWPGRPMKIEAPIPLLIKEHTFNHIRVPIII